MKNDDEQRELEALFEHTRAEPSAFELTRMAARARELPTRLERVPRRLPRWSWAPAFAAFAAIGALGLTLTQVLAPDEERGAPAVQPTPLAPSGPPVPSSDPSAGVAPMTTTSEAPLASPAADDDRELDGLPYAPETDDDPFDLSIAEETELLR
jgi:hypothetical protein